MQSLKDEDSPDAIMYDKMMPLITKPLQMKAYWDLSQKLSLCLRVYVTLGVRQKAKLSHEKCTHV